MRTAKCLIALLMPGYVAAGGSAQDEPTVGDLARIQAETLLIKAQAKQEDARNELASKRSAGGMDDGTLPVVKSIFGTDRRVVATLIYPGNVLVEAVPGDMLPGGYRVGKIHQDANKVELVKGKERHAVGFSTVVPAARQPISNTQPGQIGAPVAYVPGIAK